MSGQNVPVILSEDSRTKLHATYEAVNKKLASLKKANNKPTRTNGQFKFTPAGTSSYDIHSNKDMSMLIQIHSFLKSKVHYYDESAKDLGVSGSGYPPFTWCGYPAEDWIHDLKIRVAVLHYDSEYKRLTELKQQLSEFFVPEDKLTALLKSLDGDIEV